MAKIAFYQKYRSSTFDEVVGQEYIVQSIKNAVREGKVGHAYLFCGPRGTGKTTMARILAKAVNCENPEKAPCGECDNCKAAENGTHPDIIEINAANETHVEDIRDLIDRSRLAPMQGTHKVYIIDEVHQLSSAASSALLKTLEEPPENVIFILATTDPQKLLPTIISRCQRFDFTKIRTDQIQHHLLHIASEENIQMDDEAALMIAQLADGGMRDAESILDQCASYTSDHIASEDIDRIYGLTGVDEKIGMLKDILNHDLPSILNRTKSYEEKGIDLQRYTDGLIEVLKETVVYSSTEKPNLLKLLDEDTAKELSEETDVQSCMHMCEKLIDAKTKFRTSGSAVTCFEVACLAMAVEDSTVYPAKKHACINAEKPMNTKPAMHTQNTEDIEKTAVMASDSEPKTEPVKKTVTVPAEEKAVTEPKKIVSASKKIYRDETITLSTEEILSILVQCDKPSKASDEQMLEKLSDDKKLEDRKYTALLQSTAVGASGTDCLLLIAGAVSAKRINEKKMNRELYFFLKEQRNTDKMLYAVTKEQYKEATELFVKRMKDLPEPMKIEKYQKAEAEKEETPEEKTLKLFGKNNVEVI